jgi:Domain of unknown function (DUF1906)
MDLIAAPATVGAWVDTDFPLSSHAISALVSVGKVGVVRYVPLPGNDSAGDISRTELENICGAGLELMLVQHPRYAGWDPSQHSGDADAAAALMKAADIGYPHGCHLYLDLEGINSSAFATISYSVDWQHTLIAGLLNAGLYVGYGVPLHPQDLFDLPGFNTYWSDPANRQVATRGTAMLQGPTVTIAGVKFDLDAMRPDLLGQLPFACKLAA